MGAGGGAWQAAGRARQHSAQPRGGSRRTAGGSRAGSAAQHAQPGVGLTMSENTRAMANMGWLVPSSTPMAVVSPMTCAGAGRARDARAGHWGGRGLANEQQLQGSKPGCVRRSQPCCQSPWINQQHAAVASGTGSSTACRQLGLQLMPAAPAGARSPALCGWRACRRC